MIPSPTTISLELMEILTKINDNVNEVKNRLTRIEAQDHSDSIKMIRAEVVEERKERIKLQIELSNIKTKLAPIVAGIAIAGATVLQLIFQTLNK